MEVAEQAISLLRERERESIRAMMKTSSLLCPLLLLLLLVTCSRGDPDPIFDYCVADAAALAAQTFFFNGVPCIDPAKAKSSHFATSVLTHPGNTSANPFGFSAALTNVTNLPGSNMLGLTLVRGEIAPGGLVPPHSHPRATEAVLLLEGEMVAAFVDTANRLFQRRLRPMEVFMIPRGLIHFQYNPDKTTPALLVAVFNSQNPGVQVTASAMFVTTPRLDVEILGKAFQISEEQAREIRKNLGG